MILKRTTKVSNRLQTYVGDLDKAMYGGIPEGSIVLLSGEAGAMKTTLAFHTLYHNAINKKKSIYVTLEETGANIIQQVQNMGYDLKKVKIKTISDPDDQLLLISPETDIVIVDIGFFRQNIRGITKKREETSWPYKIQTLMDKINSDCSIFVLDSLTAFYDMSDFDNPRKDIYHMFNYFRNNKITSLFISEIFQNDTRSFHEVQKYLADGIIQMRHEKRDLKMLGMINIPKMRRTKIDKDYYIYEYENNNFKLYKKLD